MSENVTIVASGEVEEILINVSGEYINEYITVTASEIGMKGNPGETPIFSIGSVTSGVYPEVRNVGSGIYVILDFVLPVILA